MLSIFHTNLKIPDNAHVLYKEKFDLQIYVEKCGFKTLGAD